MAALEMGTSGTRTERLTTTEATCRLCWHLGHGEAISTAQAAALIGYSHDGAWRMLARMSRYWPITQDDDGLWMLECMMNLD